MLGQPPAAIRAAPVQQVEHAGRYVRLGHRLGQQDAAQGGLLAGLDDHRAAGRDRGHCLAQHLADRRVPAGYGDDDADRFLDQLDPLAMPFRKGVRRQEIEDRIEMRKRHHALALRDHRRQPGFADEMRGDCGRGLLESGAHAAQQRHPLLDAAVPPAFEGAARGRDGAIRILGRAHHGLADEREVRRAEDVHRLGPRRSHPFAADIEAIRVQHSFSHGGLMQQLKSYDNRVLHFPYWRQGCILKRPIMS